MKLFLLLLVLCQIAFGRMPDWVDRLPPMSYSYYYRIGQATGKTEDEAVRAAYRNVLMESADAIEIGFKSGTLVNENDSPFRSEKGYLISVNKVCQYTEYIVYNGYKAYVLCQVGKDPREKPQYKSFDCKNNKEY